jgi:hypothetical protein
VLSAVLDRDGQQLSATRPARRLSPTPTTWPCCTRCGPPRPPPPAAPPRPARRRPALRIPDEPYAVAQWRREHPGQDLPDGQVFIQPWPATGTQKAAGRRDKVIYYQYRADRGRRTLRGIDEQVAKAEKAVAGLVPVKRDRFITFAMNLGIHHARRKPTAA